ncbi:hypothetical protein [Sphingomonas sp. Leaf21]|uniref:hypothetical protein n=1 Tax=Sphingomonas sp. Leaf21 TaxID=2876550 RepID=UPI001E3FDCF6|nr:hypothetical protein [Sphingomonas sp. Leaf21]
MKIIPKLALAAVLATSVSGVALAVPAAAEKKKEEAGGLKLSPEALKAAQAAQPVLQQKNYAAADPLVSAVEAAAKTEDDKYIAAALRYELESGKLFAAQQANPNAPVDESSLAKPLDVLIASPSTPAADKPRYVFRRGALAYNGKQYPIALQYFQQAKQLGYQDPNLQMLIVKAKMDSGDVAGANTELASAIDQMNASGQKAPEDYYKYAIGRANKAKMVPETLAWMRKWIVAYPTAQNWRNALVIYGLQPGSLATLDKNQRLDLFRLMRATKSLADQNDYMEYAQYATDKGLPAEAEKVLNEGMASGKIPAGNATAKAMLAAATAKSRQEGSLAPTEARAKSAADGKLAALTAEAYYGQGNYAKAAELYRTALQKGGVDANEVNTRLGIALAAQGDKAGAKAAFDAVQGQPRADLAGFWKTYLDAQV